MVGRHTLELCHWLMKYFLLVFIFVCSVRVESGQTVAVSAGGKLTVFRVDGTQLSRAQEIDLNDSSGPMGVSPDQKLLYVNTAVADPDGGKKKIAAFSTFSVHG